MEIYGAAHFEASFCVLVAACMELCDFACSDCMVLHVLGDRGKTIRYVLWDSQVLLSQTQSLN